jgi:hypothetical protein
MLYQVIYGCIFQTAEKNGSSYKGAIQQLFADFEKDMIKGLVVYTPFSLNSV